MIATAPYTALRDSWPTSGKRILAQFTDETIVVYQAYCPEIAAFAVENQRFGGTFWRDRMTWIKPNFLWMMHRCGWATKSDQERVLAIHLRRDGFDRILGEAVPSSYDASSFSSWESWQEAVARSEVRLQWDPDHTPSGGKCDRRAIQLGLRGDALRRYESDWLAQIEDITDFVWQQASLPVDERHVPRETIYPLSLQIAQHLGADL